MEYKKTNKASTAAPKCEFCDGGQALVIGKTNDYGIAIQSPNTLMAYGYDVHGSGSNGLTVKIKYCPMCGKKLSDSKKPLPRRT